MKFERLDLSKRFQSVLSLMVFASIALLTASFCDAQNSLAQIPTSQETEKPKDGEWRTITPSDARAIFRMPKKPRYVERTFSPVREQPPIKVRLHIATVGEGTMTYIFGYHDLHRIPADTVTVNKALDGAVRGSVVNVSGQLVGKVEKIRFQAHPGRQFTYRYAQGGKRFVVVARVFLVEGRQYQLTSLMAESVFNEALAADFLNSFKLVEPESDEPPVPRLNK